MCEPRHCSSSIRLNSLAYNNPHKPIHICRILKLEMAGKINMSLSGSHRLDFD